MFLEKLVSAHMSTRRNYQQTNSNIGQDNTPLPPQGVSSVLRENKKMHIKRAHISLIKLRKPGTNIRRRRGGIKTDLEETGCGLAQTTDQWWALVNTIINLLVP
jgi:hypothetical protein